MGLVIVAGLLASAPLSVRAQQEVMSADLPFGTAPGDTVTLTGTVGSECDPGSAEVGFSTASFEEFSERMSRPERTPLTGDETVLHRPTVAPGKRFEVQIVVPDPGVAKPLFYALCRFTDEFGPPDFVGSYGPFTFGTGAGSPDPEPTATGNRAPVAVADAYEAGTNERVEIPAPGVLGNDRDPDGDQIVAVVQARMATTAASARFWPNGALEARADEPGMLCVEYVARDPSGAVSAPVAVVISVGGADDPSTVVEGDGCRTPPLDDDLFEFVVEHGEGELTDEMVASRALAPGSSLGALSRFAAIGVGMTVGDVLAGRVPRGARCTVNTCLWGYFMPPYYGCNQNIFRISFGRSRYGSMTTYGYIRKGLADYVKVRGHYYQDGQLIHSTGWETKYFGGTHFNNWTSVRMHFQFPNPQSIYRTAFQAQWWQAVDWAKDRQIAETNGVGPVPLECMAGP